MTFASFKLTVIVLIHMFSVESRAQPNPFNVFGCTPSEYTKDIFFHRLGGTTNARATKYATKSIHSTNPTNRPGAIHFTVSVITARGSVVDDDLTEIPII